jgi:hypothetical protein
MFGKHTIALVFALFLSLVLLGGVALAGKGGGHNPAQSGSGTLTLVLLDSTDGLAHFGQHVTYTLSTTLTYPYVNENCYVNGVLVSNDWRGFFPSSLSSTTFTLGGSQLWQSGAADCTAYLVYQTSKGWSRVASTSFHVYP